MGGTKSVKFMADFMTLEATIRGIIARLEYDYLGVYMRRSEAAEGVKRRFRRYTNINFGPWPTDWLAGWLAD